MKKTLKLTLPLLVGGFLCWYAYQQFTEEQFAEIKKTFLSADYFYIILSVFLGFLADMSRAVRWEFLLRPMGYRTSLLHRAMAVFMGYLVNVTIPRSGEVSRALLVSNYDGVPFEKSFGSSFILSKIPFQKLLWIALIGGASFVVFLYLVYTSQRKLFVKVKGFLSGIKEGVLSVMKIRHKTLFLLHTLFIWAMYFLMFYIPFFALPETATISLTNVLTAFVVGSFAMTFTNAGFGSYPFFIAEVLFLFGVATPIGTAFGWIVWTSQFAMTLLLGGLSFALLPLIKENKNK